MVTSLLVNLKITNSLMARCTIEMVICMSESTKMRFVTVKVLYIVKEELYIKVSLKMENFMDKVYFTMFLEKDMRVISKMVCAKVRV